MGMLLPDERVAKELCADIIYRLAIYLRRLSFNRLVTGQMMLVN